MRVVRTQGERGNMGVPCVENWGINETSAQLSSPLRMMAMSMLTRILLVSVQSMFER